MTKKCALLLILFYISNDCIGVDLQQKISKDSINQLLSLSEEMTSKNIPTEGISIAELALELSTEINYNYGVAMAAYQLASNFHELGAHYKLVEIDSVKEYKSYHKSIRLSQKSILLAKQYGFLKIVVDAYAVQGFNYRLMFDKKSALIAFQKGVEVAKEIDEEYTVKAMDLIARMHYHNANYAEAIQVYYQIIEYSKSNNKEVYYENNLYKISRALSRNGDTKTGNQFLLKIINSTNNYLFLKADAYQLLGQNYFNTENYDSAFYSFIKAKEIDLFLKKRADFNRENELSLHYVSLAKVRYVNNDPIEAQSLLKEAVEMRASDIKPNLTTEILMLNAKILAKLGNNKLSIIKLKEALELALKMDYLNEMMSALQLLSEQYAYLTKYDSAYKYQKKFISVKDEIFDNKKSNQISELNTKYNIAQKEQEIVLQSIQLNQVRNKIIVFTFVLVFLTVAISVVIYYYIRTKKIKNELNKLNSTKDRLFSIISHDLRGAVTGFKDIGQIMLHYLKKGDLKSVEDIAQNIDKNANKLTQLLNNLLDWSIQQLGETPFNPKKLLLKDEINKVTELFKDIANAKSITIREEVEENLSLLADENGIQLILRNLISNAIKFTNEGEEIVVSAQKENDSILLTVKDNGVGIPANKIATLFTVDAIQSSQGTGGEKGTGLGLSLCKHYIDLHDGSVSVESKENEGTTFTINIPITD